MEQSASLTAEVDVTPFIALAKTALFIQEKDEDPFCDDNPDDFATLVGAARLGDKAAIGSGFWIGAHGGAVSPTCPVFESLQSDPIGFAASRSGLGSCD